MGNGAGENVADGVNEKQRIVEHQAAGHVGEACKREERERGSNEDQYSWAEAVDQHGAYP